MISAVLSLEEKLERGFCIDNIKVVYCGVFILDLPNIIAARVQLYMAEVLDLRWYELLLCNPLQQITVQPKHLYKCCRFAFEINVFVISLS